MGIKWRASGFADRPRLIGQVIALGEGEFHLEFDSGGRRLVDNGEVLGFEHSLGMRRQWQKGLAIGAGTGVGLAFAFPCVPDASEFLSCFPFSPTQQKIFLGILGGGSWGEGWVR